VQRDPDAPAIGRGPDQQAAEHHERDQPQDVVRSSEAKIDQDDDRGDRQAIADDRERPRVTGIPLVYESTDGTALDVMRPAGEERSLAAVRAAFADAPAKRGEDHMQASVTGC